MRYLLPLLLFVQTLLFAEHYDCIVVGSSPFSLFEALYQQGLGKSVLILEELPICGGAWQSIEVCGIPRADLGCHQIGHDLQLKSFLEEYAGCKIVSLDDPLKPFDPSHSPNGYYFSQGCFELVDHLLQLIDRTNIVVKTNYRVETLSVDPSRERAIVGTPHGSFTASKVLLTPMCCFPNKPSKTKYYHLYMLIQDPTPPRFCYKSPSISGISRMINLSHFTNTASTGRQLIVFQTHSDRYLSEGQKFLDSLKEKGLVDACAYILKEEPLIYESGYLDQGAVQKMEAPHLFEILNTGHIHTLSNSISKWKAVMKPWNALFSNR